MDYKSGPAQLRLLRDPFHPLSHGSGHYLVALQNLKGERDALRHIDPVTWERTTPLIHFVGPKTAKDQLRVSTVKNWVKAIAGVLGGRSCFVDFLRMKPTQAVAMGPAATAPAAEVIFDACRQRAMRFVPIVHVGHATRAVQLVADAVAQDGRGVCLRYSVIESVAATGTTAQGILSQTLKAVDTPVEEADVILDLGWLDPDDSVDLDALTSIIKDVCAVGGWRSVVLLGTSMPSALGGVPEGTVGRLPRQEWALWRGLMSEPIDRLPSFGDYAIQNPRPPIEGGGPGMRRNIRYTAEDATVVARAAGASFQEDNEQYRELCQRLVALPEFCGADYSWGDETIAGCAEYAIEPRGQSMWRGVGCSHHVRFVVEGILRSQGLTS